MRVSCALSNVRQVTTANTTGRVPVIDLPIRLMLARTSAGMKQAELAKAIGVSRATVANYECTNVEPRRSVVMAWAMATGVDLRWIITGETAGDDGDGGDPPAMVRPKGFEPLTFCSVRRRSLTSVDTDAA